MMELYWFFKTLSWVTIWNALVAGTGMAAIVILVLYLRKK